MQSPSPEPRLTADEYLSAAPDALRNEVKFLEAPGAEPYVMTVEEMIRHEAEHARKHLQAVNDALKQRLPS